jgi:hypothetical protein
VCVNELLAQVIKTIIIAAQKTVETFYCVYLENFQFNPSHERVPTEAAFGGSFINEFPQSCKYQSFPKMCASQAQFVKQSKRDQYSHTSEMVGTGIYIHSCNTDVAHII